MEKPFGQVVEVQVVDTDRYGRTVGRVHRGDLEGFMRRVAHEEARQI